MLCWWVFFFCVCMWWLIFDEIIAISIRESVYNPSSTFYSDIFPKPICKYSSFFQICCSFDTLKKLRKELYRLVFSANQESHHKCDVFTPTQAIRFKFMTWHHRTQRKPSYSPYSEWEREMECISGAKVTGLLLLVLLHCTGHFISYQDCMVRYLPRSYPNAKYNTINSPKDAILVR